MRLELLFVGTVSALNMRHSKNNYFSRITHKQKLVAKKLAKYDARLESDATLECEDRTANVETIP